MGLIAKNNGGDFELPPAGNHVARCCRVIDLGTQDVEWQGKVKRQSKVMISWELVDEKMSDGRPFTISRTITNSLAQNGNLRPMLESWRGKAFTEQDLEGWDLRKVLNAPCMVNVVHEKSKDGSKTYANVSSVASLPKGMKASELTNEQVVYSVEDGKSKVFCELSDYLRDKIARCHEWSDAKDETPEPRAELPPGADEDDNIPF